MVRDKGLGVESSRAWRVRLGGEQGEGGKR